MRMRSVLLVAVLLLAGCSATVKTTALRAGRVEDAARYRQLAVLPFDGNAGYGVSYQVEAALSGVVVEGRPYFQLADRKQLSRVIDELKLGQSGLSDPGSMARVGRIAGVRGILGGMASEQLSESRYREERSACEEYEYRIDKDGKKRQGACIRYRRWQAACVKRQSNVSVIPRLVDAESARVVYSRSIQGSKRAEGCLDTTTPAALADLTRAAWDEALEELRKDLAPYTVALEIELSDDERGLPSGAAQERFAQGVTFARGQRLDRACELWRGLEAHAATAPFLAYNLGVCAELDGRYEQAERHYRQADRQMTEPDERLGRALARVRDFANEQRKLKGQAAR